MEFAHPYFLVMLLILPILIYWYYKFGKNQEATIRYSSIKLIPKNILNNGLKLHLLFIYSRLIIIFVLIIALSRPRLVDQITKTKAEIIDILLVIDQSSSMLAQDFEPNRLEAVKKVAKSFISDRRGDRIGVVIFAGETYIQCPLTRDINILLEFTDQIKVADREYDGTAIGMAIANSINRLRDSKAKTKIMILLSDGSNNKGELDPLTAAELAKNFNIKIYTVAAGKTGLAPYPIVDAWGRTIIQNVEVQVDEQTLKNIAQITNGKFFRATDNKSLGQVYKEIDRLEKTEIDIKEFKNYTELYNWFIIPMIIFSMLIIFFFRIRLLKLF